MNNLFLVINKEKIYAYIVSIMTVLVLFLMSGIMQKDLKEVEETSSNIVESNSAVQSIDNSYINQRIENNNIVNNNTIKETSSMVDSMPTAIDDAIMYKE